MKKLILLTSFVAMVFGFSSASSAQCTVRDGDSMYKIAKRYNVPFHVILDINRHFANPHLIFPKDKIELPDGFTGKTTDLHSGDDNIADGGKEITQTPASDQAQAVLKLVNAERQKQGLKALSLSEKVTSVANLKAKDMAEKNYFSHTSPTYGTPFQMLQSYGISYRSAGENIAAGQRSAEEVMQAWMNSSGHRANILNANFTEIGIGYYAGGNYGTEWVQMFIGN